MVVEILKFILVNLFFWKGIGVLILDEEFIMFSLNLIIVVFVWIALEERIFSDLINGERIKMWIGNQELNSRYAKRLKALQSEISAKSDSAVHYENLLAFEFKSKIESIENTALATYANLGISKRSLTLTDWDKCRMFGGHNLDSGILNDVTIKVTKAMYSTSVNRSVEDLAVIVKELDTSKIFTRVSLEKTGNISCWVAKDELSDAVIFLRDYSRWRYAVLSDIVGVDTLGSITVVYLLLSCKYGIRIKLNCKVEIEQSGNLMGEVESLEEVYGSARPLEREVYDMFGIWFKGNKDMRRILLDYGFRGYPLRKDYPVMGYKEYRYDDLKKRIVAEDIEASQEIRTWGFKKVENKTRVRNFMTYYKYNTIITKENNPEKTKALLEELGDDFSYVDNFWAEVDMHFVEMMLRVILDDITWGNGDYLIYYFPEISLIEFVIIYLLAGLFIKRKKHKHLRAWTIGVFIYLGGVISLYWDYQAYGIGYGISKVGNMPEVLSVGIIYSKIFLISILMVQILLGWSYLHNEKMRKYEYYVILILILLGLISLISANDLVNMYLLLELQGLGFYVMIVLKHYRTYYIEAGLKYLIVSSFTSGMFLFGMSLFYMYTGLLNFEELNDRFDLLHTDLDEKVLLCSICLIFLSVLFKLGVFPFHMWMPDVYEGSPTLITVLLAIMPKFGFVMLLVKLILLISTRLKLYLFIILDKSIWGSFLVGTVTALYQVKIKRLLAYSAITNMGFILIGLVSNNQLGMQSMLFFVIIYVILTLTVFMHIIELRSAVNNRLVKVLNHLTGLLEVNIALTYSLTLTFFSMGGIPPLSGFLSKFYVLYSGMSSHLYLLLCGGIIASVLAVVYYIRVVRILHFTKSKQYLYLKNINILNGWLIACFSLSSIFIFILPDFFYNLTGLLVLNLIKG